MAHETLMSDISIEWDESNTLVNYPDAVACMEARAKDIALGHARERVWLSKGA